MTAGNASQWQENIADIATGIDTLASQGGTAGVQYTDGASAPTHPIGGEIVFNYQGTMTAVSDLNPLPTWTSTPPSNQRVSAQLDDFETGSIVDLATLLTLAGTPTDANTINSFMGRLTKIRDLLNATLTVQGTITEANSAASKADLDTLAGIVSSNKAAVKSAANDIADLSTLLARHTDTFGSNTAISAATTFGSIPLVSVIAANSSANLTNSSYQDTFIVQINVASAFNGTIGFYGLLPDATTLQQINAHLRNSSTTNNSTAINTSSALEQTWEGSIAGFKAIYVVCTAFTSGSASVQLGLTAANYAHAILNTVAQNLTQVNGSAISLGQTTKANSLPVTLPSDATIPINTGTPAETAVTVGASNTSVLAANANRKFLSLVNDSNNTIYVTFSGTNAALNTGTRLNANGGAILFDRYVPTAAVKAIATAASSNLLVTEG